MWLIIQKSLGPSANNLSPKSNWFQLPLPSLLHVGDRNSVQQQGREEYYYYYYFLTSGASKKNEMIDCVRDTVFMLWSSFILINSTVCTTLSVQDIISVLEDQLWLSVDHLPSAPQCSVKLRAVRCGDSSAFSVHSFEQEHQLTILCWRTRSNVMTMLNSAEISSQCASWKRPCSLHSLLTIWQ